MCRSLQAGVPLLLLLAAARLSAQAPRVPSIAEAHLLAAANLDRAAHGLALLTSDPALTAAAEAHARQMAQRGTISHQFDGEPGLAERASAAGAAFSLITENVAEAMNAAAIHELWIHSAGHRANLLDPAVDRVGIAVVRQGAQYFAVEDFARFVPRLSLAAQESAVAGLLTRDGLGVEPGAAEARATCALESGYRGQARPGFVMRWTAANLTGVPEALTTRLATGRYRRALVGACPPAGDLPFTRYSLAVLLFP